MSDSNCVLIFLSLITREGVPSLDLCFVAFSRIPSISSGALPLRFFQGGANTEPVPSSKRTTTFDVPGEVDGEHAEKENHAINRAASGDACMAWSNLRFKPPASAGSGAGRKSDLSHLSRILRET